MPKKNLGGRPSAVHDISPKVRAAFIRALARLGASKSDPDAEREMADLLEKSLKKDFLGTMNMMAKFNPRETNLKAQVTGLADVLRELNERDSIAATGGPDSDLEIPAPDLRH